MDETKAFNAEGTFQSKNRAVVTFNAKDVCILLDETKEIWLVMMNIWLELRKNWKSIIG